MDTDQEFVHSSDGGHFNRHGGLTIVAMPGFEAIAEQVKALVVERGQREGMHRTPVDVIVPIVGRFDSDEPKIRLRKQHIGGHDVVILTSGPGTPDMLMNLQLILGNVSGRQAERITVVSGYFPCGRADKDDEQELAIPPILLAAWKGAAPELKRVVCVDPHSTHITGSRVPGMMVTPVRMTRRLLTKVITDALSINPNVVLSFPDNSAHKRFKDALKLVKQQFGRTFPIVFATADRDDDGKAIELVWGATESVPGALVIQLDDETASGGTQISVAKLLKERGAAEVWGAVTHGVLCGNAPANFQDSECPIQRLYVIDTIPVSNRPELRPLLEMGRLHVISWIEDMAWVVYMVHWDSNIRDLR